MKLLITGANGFLGNYVVCEALRRGHTVRALVRPTANLTDTAWFAETGVEVVQDDLSGGSKLIEALKGVECVIHLAAARTGDADAQFEATVRATERLLAAMQEALVWRMVAISSLSVYDYTFTPAGTCIDENSRLENDGIHRDTYARMKLLQERLIRKFADMEGWDLVVLRPGMIWGKGQILNAWVGSPIGSKFWLRIGGKALVPLTYVENCAQAVVLAAESNAALGHTFNIIDDDPPTQQKFLAIALNAVSAKRIVMPIPYHLLRALAVGVFWINEKLLGGKLKLPGVFVPCRIDARAKPLKWSNQRIKQFLGWEPRYRLFAAMDRAIASVAPPIEQAASAPQTAIALRATIRSEPDTLEIPK